MDIKNFLFKNAEKVILGIAVCYLIYIAFHTFLILHLEICGVNTKLQSVTCAIDGKLKTSVPPSMDMELKDAIKLESRFTTPPDANPIQRPYIFSKFTQEETISGITTGDLLKKSEGQIPPRLETAKPGDTEFIFRGGTADLALIQVRKLYSDRWWTRPFAVGRGKTIGKKKFIGHESVDFDTHCKLVEIVPNAQKPIIIKKTTVIRDEKGEFLGTSLTEETHMVSTSRIVFENEKGESYNLWIGESVNLGVGTVTISSLKSNPSGNE